MARFEVHPARAKEGVCGSEIDARFGGKGDRIIGRGPLREYFLANAREVNEQHPKGDWQKEVGLKLFANREEKQKQGHENHDEVEITPTAEKPGDSRTLEEGTYGFYKILHKHPFLTNDRDPFFGSHVASLGNKNLDDLAIIWGDDVVFEFHRLDNA